MNVQHVPLNRQTLWGWLSVTITVSRTTRKTSVVQTAEFSTERGALEHVRALLHDHTNLPLRFCEDTAGLLCNPYFTVRQQRYGPFLFTIVRT
jgi:hypothetical protein